MAQSMAAGKASDVVENTFRPTKSMSATKGMNAMNSATRYTSPHFLALVLPGRPSRRFISTSTSAAPKLTEGLNPSAIH